MILETRAWRDRLFAEREPKPGPTWLDRIRNQGGAVPGMFGGGGQLALNQLLVVMDGIDNPPFFRRLFTNWTNTLLDATYFIPRAGRPVRLRVPRPKPRKDQIYFIGATNVPLSALDPALTRPGRMGRHVWLRTPRRTTARTSSTSTSTRWRTRPSWTRTRSATSSRASRRATRRR